MPAKGERWATRGGGGGGMECLHFPFFSCFHEEGGSSTRHLHDDMCPFEARGSSRRGIRIIGEGWIGCGYGWIWREARIRWDPYKGRLGLGREQNGHESCLLYVSNCCTSIIESLSNRKGFLNNYCAFMEA